MLPELQLFIDRQPSAPVIIHEELLPVIERIHTYLPMDKIWEYYVSKPCQTGGRVEFPYARMDTGIVAVRDVITILKSAGKSQADIDRLYTVSSNQALRALMYIEIGFEGLENYAHSSESRDWTADGHHLTEEERAAKILINGRELMDECFGKFVAYRRDHGITQDCFSEYGVEWLLDKWNHSLGDII